MAMQVEIVTDDNVGKGLTINTDKLDVNIDNATVILKENGELAVPGAVMEVVDFDSLLQPNDTHYVTTEDKWLRHVQTGAEWQVSVTTLHERGAPRDEELTSALVPTLSLSESTDARLAFKVPNVRSAVDGENVYFKENPLLVDRTAYANAEAFNAANLKGVFTSPSRFSSAGNQPLLHETNFEVALPKLPFGDHTVTFNLREAGGHGSQANYFESFVEPAVRVAVQKLYEMPVTLTCEITDLDGITSNGTYTTERGPDIVLRSINSSQKQVWNAAPITIDTFFGRVTFNFTEFVA